jgi:hypothetical protein
VHGTEGVVDVGAATRTLAGEGGEPVGEGAALVVVLTGLGLFEPHVLQQQHVAVLHLRHLVPRGRAGDAVVAGFRERDRPAEQLTHPLGDRRERVLRVDLSLGAAEVRQHDHPRARVGERPDHREAGPDAAVVGDAGRPRGLTRGVGGVERNVEVGADEHASAPDPLVQEVVEGLHGRGESRLRRLRAGNRRGQRGRRRGSSSRTRCRTSR